MIAARLSPLTLILLLFGCSHGHEQDARIDDSTRQMAERLADLSETLSVQNPFANSIRLAWLHSQPVPDEPSRQFQYYHALGEEALNAGETREAIDSFHIAERLIEEHDGLFAEEHYWQTTAMLAISYLRLGEQENCIENPTSASCIVPIRGEGVHLLEEGSRRAIDYYTRMAEAGRGGLNAVWLMNIAYMTLGEYPEEIPQQWLIPPSAFEPDGEFPFFNEIAMDLGLDVAELSGASIADDFTGNGLLDLFVTSWSLKDNVRLFENNGDGTFTDITARAGLTGITGGLNAVHADYTNNGFPDIYLMRGAWQGPDGNHPNSLIRNNGDGTFTDVTLQAGVEGAWPTQTASWGDYNNNGLIDLLVGYESAGRWGTPGQLFRNNGDGTFTDVAEESGLNFSGFVKAVIWGDYDNDGYLDIYVSRFGQPNLLFRNEGPDENGNWSFREVAAEAGVREPLNSFPVWFWDYNNNGLLDLFVASYSIEYDDVVREFRGEPIRGEIPRLYRNNGDGTFTNVTEEAGLNGVIYPMGVNFGDLDNDGYLDFYLGTGDPDYRSIMPNRMFRNEGGERFRDVTFSGGFGNIQKGHAISFADFNNNGFQEIHANMGGALEGDVYQNLLFENPTNDNNWITLSLVGEQSNRSALQTQIRIDVNGEEGRRSIHRRVTSGGTFGGSPLRQEIGLGRAERIEAIEIRWPATGISQRFENVEMNRFYRIREGSERMELLDLQPFEYHKGEGLHREGHHHH